MTVDDARCIGVAGLGTQGIALCKRLQAAGYAVSAYDLDPVEMLKLAGHGVDLCVTPRELAQCPVVVLTGHSDVDLETIVFGEQGLLTQDTDMLVVDLSGPAGERTRSFAARAARAGARWVDAHWSGGPAHGDDAMTVALGGSSTDIDGAAWMFTRMGCRCAHAGGVGDAHTLGLIETAIVSGQQALALEIEALVSATSLSMDVVRGQLTGSLADRSILDVQVADRAGYQGSLIAVRQYAESIGVAVPITSALVELQRMVASQR